MSRPATHTGRHQSRRRAVKSVRRRAFTLVELLVVMTVLAVLTAVAYPSYLGQVHRIRRNTGKQFLAEIAQQLERCHSRYRRYDDPACPLITGDPTISVLSPDGLYRVSSRNPDGVESLPLVPSTLASRPPAESFTLYATAQGSQTGDTECAVLQQDSGGAQAAFNAGALTSTPYNAPANATTARCW